MGLSSGTRHSGLGSYIDDFAAATDKAWLTVAIPSMEAGDEYYILDSWDELLKYTATTIRTPGDIAYVRADMKSITRIISLSMKMGQPQAGFPL